MKNVMNAHPREGIPGAVAKYAIVVLCATVLAVALACAGCRSNEGDLVAPSDGGPNGKSGAYVEEAYYETGEAYYGAYDGYVDDEPVPVDFNTEEYSPIKEHGFTSVASAPFSTFGADVDTASYCNWRRMTVGGYTLSDLPNGAVRVEEMLNYFKYDYATPEDGELFGLTATLADCPWNDETKLLVLGLATEPTDYAASEGNNLVFLVDISGSMGSEDKLPLLQESFSYLVDQLNPGDTVSIVTYAAGEELILDGEKARNKRAILAAIDSLEADGYTDGQSGLAMAYEVAERHFIEGGNNRIIMASDGDLNVGITSESELSEYVSGQREKGIYLSVFGFGEGNYKDNKMETLADDGNGTYYYIDCLAEAKRIFGEDLCSTMIPVADDVKLQIEFNPAYVRGYRQIGYENRELSADEFKDDKADAGELGAGHCLTVAYELVMADSPMELFTSESRYNDGSEGIENGEWLCLNVRYKDPGAAEALERNYPMGEEIATDEPGEDFRFASAVIEYSMLANDSENLGTATPESVLEILGGLEGADDRRTEFAQLAQWSLYNSYKADW